jgi:hypothetical protein
MAATGHGATFVFAGSLGTISGRVTRLSVETPAAEVVDMTGVLDSPTLTVLVPTGSWRGGSVSVDFVGDATIGDVQLYVRSVGSLTFRSPGHSVARQVILESASSQVAVGDVVRGSLKFLMTDYYP